MDYDKIFENNLDRKFFFSNEPGNKIMVGKISLTNAMARLNKREYYTLVTYQEGDVLPEQYLPLSSLTSDDGTLFATINPNNRFYYICQNGGIQMITRLPNLDSGSPSYLLGPGPETVSLDDLVMSQYEKYLKEETPSARKGR